MSFADPDSLRHMNQTTTPSHVGIAAAIWLVQLLVSAVYFAHMLLSQLSVASCTETACDYSLFAGINQAFNIGLAGALLLSAVGIFAMRKRGRWAMAAPILGIVTATVLVFVAYPLSRATLELPLFGNRV